MTRQHAVPIKTEVKRLILGLLEAETGDDYSALKHQVDVDLTCDAHVDSLSMANIAIDIEDALGITIEDSEVIPERLRSLEAFASFLVAKVAATSGVRKAV